MIQTMPSLKGKTKVLNRINAKIQTLLDAPELEDLSDQQLTQIAGAVLVDTLKDKLKTEVRKSKIDVNKLKQDWLDLFTSHHTQRSFSKNLDHFLSWLGEKSILEVDAQLVDNYLIYLKSTKTNGLSSRGKSLSNNSIRQRIHACSSFWKSLSRWGIVQHNPWHGCQMPKKKIDIKQSESVPTNDELDTIEKYCLEAMQETGGKGSVNRINGARKALGALKVLRTTGLRVGSLPTLTIDKNKYYKAESKGGVAEGRLKEEVIKALLELKLDKRQPFKKYNGFSMYFNRIVKKLKLSFSVHGIRHRFAVDYYKQTNDIASLQKLLGHSSLLATQSYLATLKTEIE